MDTVLMLWHEGMRLAPAVITWILTYAIHSTLLILVAWLALHRMPRATPALRERFWKTAMIGGLLTATVQMAGGIDPLGGRIPLALGQPPSLPSGDMAQWVHSGPPDSSLQTLLDDARARVRANPGNRPRMMVLSTVSSRETMATSCAGTSGAGTAAFRVFTIPTERVVVRELRYRFSNSPDDSLDLGLALTGTPGGPTLPRTPQPRTASLAGWAIAALGVWIGGILFLALRWFAGRRRLQRLLSDRRLITDGPLIAMLQELMARGGVRRAIRLSSSPRLTTPIALGWREICLPERALGELSAREQQAILAHELAHLVRGDNLWLHIAAAVSVVCFFQPLNRLARRGVQEAGEFLCDDWAVRHTRQHLDLARCLARVADWVRRPAGSAVYAAGMNGGGSALRRRVERILSPPRESGRGGRFAVAAMLALPCMVAWAAPAVTPMPITDAPTPRRMMVFIERADYTVSTGAGGARMHVAAQTTVADSGAVMEYRFETDATTMRYH